MPKRRKKIKNKKVIYSLALIPLIIILFLFGWFLAIIFEGEKPIITLQPLPEFLSESLKFTLKMSDLKRGLKKLKVSVSQEGREITIHNEKFLFRGLLNWEGVHQYEREIFIDPHRLNLAQGRVDIDVSVWDYSRRSGGDGNMSIAHHKMIVDTIPPSIRAISRMHNINYGGASIVVYQASSDTQESGLFIDDIFFPGFPADGESQKGMYVAYFAVPYNSGVKPSIYLWAKDKAGNHQKATFYHRIRKKRFRKDRINITDKFLNRVLPYFSFYPLEAEESSINKYIKINNDLRKENHQTFLELREKTSPKRLWEGPWLRLKKAATMSRFAVRRSYYYKGKKVDEQIHLGIDLASLPNSPVPATNDGRVLFAGRNGIYGLSVLLDHGQGLTSMYGHLGEILVTSDQYVKKGEDVGFTGQTGLAGGDHLHFSILVNGIFVDPMEWWDGHWVKNNITKKLALLNK
jgi:murein DD-endopeptidase MepM/ murein hydrolase activator NlpD